MATFTSKQYGQYPLHLALKRVSWTTDTHVIQLLASSYTPDQDNHAFQSSLSGELATGGGYTAGGQALANKTATYDPTTNTTKLDADDASWPSSTLTWRTAVIADTSPGSAATNPLESFHQGDVDTVSSGGTTTVQFNAAGIHTFVAA